MRTNFLKTSVQPLIKKLHFFDWLVLAGIAVIIVFFFYLRAARKTEIVSVRVLFTRDDWGTQTSNTPFWMAHELNPGDKAYNSLGSVVATLKTVEIVDTGGPYRNAQVVVDLEVQYDEKNHTYSYNYQPLQIGKTLNLAFEKGAVRGVVIQIADEEISYTYQTVELWIRGVLPEVAREFFVGLQATDSSGEVVAEVENVRILPNEYYQFSQSLNRSVLANNPSLRDVKFWVTLKSFQNGPTFYYVNNAALKIGNEIWIEFPRVSSGPAVITAVE